MYENEDSSSVEDNSSLEDSSSVEDNSSLEDTVTIEQITKMPIEKIEEYLYDDGYDIEGLSEKDMRYAVISIMKEEGYLDPQDAEIMESPYFSDLYYSSKGDLEEAFARLGLSFVPILSEVMMAYNLTKWLIGKR